MTFLGTGNQHSLVGKVYSEDLGQAAVVTEFQDDDEDNLFEIFAELAQNCSVSFLYVVPRIHSETD